jgi:DNA invertase Pin-like site-specific DNA recombinase
MILGYTRISSVKQQDGHSLDYQKQKINEYCSLKELPITEVFSEVKYTFEYSTRGTKTD